MRTSSNVGVEVLGTGVSGGAGITLRDPKEEIGEGYVDAWPRNVNTGRFTIPPPEPEKLDTRRRGWSLNMVVYTGTLASVKVLVKLECYPSSHVILLEDIINKRGSAPETRQAVR